ncbi:MAG: beta-lactamase family protein [Gemmataceae bacterium]|nr:beta-lactamase family protein [Gemmataceae bacterium]
MLPLVLALGLAAPPDPVTPPADFAARAEQYMAGQVAVHDFSGTVLVAVDGRPIFRRAYGYANRDWDIPNTPDTRFRIASLTKQFTAAAILVLEQQGKLSVADPVGKHVPGVPKAWAGVTLLQLMSHSSGVPEHNLAAALAPGGPARSYTPRQIVGLVKDRPLGPTDDGELAYSNTNYVLLGMVVEEVGGKEYAAFMRREVFDPLGMADTVVERPGMVVKRRATGYTGSGKGATAPYLNPTQLYAAGGMISSADDLLRWDRALADDRLLGPAARKTLFAPVKYDYACGVGVGRLFGRPIHWHGGALIPYGVKTYLLRFPDAGLCVIVLGNHDRFDAQQVAFDLAAITLGEEYDIPRPVAPPPRRKGG